MAKRKKTRPGTKKADIEKQYQKERKRLNQLARRLEKRGYIVDRSKFIPTKPKRLTEKSVERLRKIKPENVYKKIQFVDPETGEIVSGVKGKKIEKNRRTEKRKKTREPGPERWDTEPQEPEEEPERWDTEPAEPEEEPPGIWDIAIDNLLDIVRQIDIELDDPKCKNPDKLLYIQGLIQDQIDQYGQRKYAELIIDAIPQINALLETLYLESGQEKIELAFNHLIELLTPGGQMAIDVNADQNDYWEKNNGW